MHSGSMLRGIHSSENVAIIYNHLILIVLQKINHAKVLNIEDEAAF